MGDITDSIYQLSPKVKQTIAKGYNASTTTSGTSFVDVTSVTVPNNWYYVMIFDCSVNTGTTGTWKLLEGASSKDTATFVGNGVIRFDPLRTYQNTSGSSQTVKVQVKSDGLGGSPTVGLAHTSIITSPNPIIYIIPQLVATEVYNFMVKVPLNAYVTSMDVLVAIDTGGTTAEIWYNGVLPVPDSATTPQTISENRYMDYITFQAPARTYSSGIAQGLYIAYDWAGNQVIV